MHRVLRGGLVVLIGGLAAGCESAPPRGTVTGEVRLDGKPLELGSISFFPADGQAQTAGGPVSGGRFTVADVPVGEVKVVINGVKVIGKKKAYDAKDSPVYDETTEVVPARYNTKTELSFTVQPGPNEKSFDLKGR